MLDLGLNSEKAFKLKKKRNKLLKRIYPVYKLQIWKKWKPSLIIDFISYLYGRQVWRETLFDS